MISKNRDFSFLWVSVFLLFIPFEFVKGLTEYNPDKLTGSLGNTITITIPIIMIIVIFLFVKLRKISFSMKSVPFVSFVLALIIISLINPANVSKIGSFIFAVFFFSHIILFHLFSKFINPKSILIGIFDGLVILCIFQFILAICFPFLNISAVTSLFHEAGEISSTRGSTGRVGAVGLFRHPGSLALFTIISSSFFLSLYLRGIKKKICLFLLLINIFTIILTYSRTSYMTLIIVLLFINFVYHNARKNIFSISRIIKFIIPIILIFGWLIFFSPLSSIFLDSDTSVQYDNRMVHYLMGFQIIQSSPFIGVGLNSHLAFLSSNPNIINLYTLDNFYAVNPIHNSHLIIFSETGLLGFVLWLIFIGSNIVEAKRQISLRNNIILSSTLVGVLVSYCIYGMTGWAPLSNSILPFFLFFCYFGILFRKITLK